MTVLGGGIVAGGRHAEDRDSARRSAGTGARRISAGCASCGDKPKEEEKSPFRELGLPYVSDPAVTRHLAAFLACSGRRAAGRDSVQRRILHSRNSAPARRRRDGALVRPAAGDLRESRSGSGGRGGRGVLFLRPRDRRGVAGARRIAARVLHRRSAARIGRCCARCAWCRAARKKDRRSNSIREICNWWRTSRCLSGCTARARGPRIKPGDVVEFAANDRGSASARAA